MFPFQKNGENFSRKHQNFQILQRILHQIFLQMLNNFRFYDRCHKLLLDSEDCDLKELIHEISEQKEPIIVSKQRFLLIFNIFYRNIVFFLAWKLI